MGIDYGTKRIGIAISDENYLLAFPKKILLNDKDVFLNIGKIIEEEEIGEIVLGESKNFSGGSNLISKEIETFALELEKRFNLSIRKEKEFLTSVEARRYKTKSGHIDASAAALILQRYLDKRKNKLNK